MLLSRDQKNRPGTIRTVDNSASGQFAHKYIYTYFHLRMYVLTAIKYTTLCADNFQFNTRNELVWQLLRDFCEADSEIITSDT